MSRSRKSAGRLREDPFAGPTPRWPTATRRVMRDGRLVGVPGAGVHLYKKVPLAPVTDAKTTEAGLAAGEPLLDAFDQLVQMTSLRGVTRRALAKAAYRQVHVLMINVPQFFAPPWDHPNAIRLDGDYGHMLQESRLLLLGVQLRDSLVGQRGLNAAVDSVVETLTVGGAPIQDYDEDFTQVDRALTRAGLTSPSRAEISLANSWFNRGISPDPVIHPGEDNVAIFSSSATAAHARKHWGDIPIQDWPEDEGYHVLSMAAVQDLDLDWTPADQRRARWGGALLEAGAAVVSIRGILEPAAITRKEIEAKQKGVVSDINEREKANKITKAEQQQKLNELHSIHAMYGQDGAPPTLVDASVVVGFGAAVQNMEDVLGPASPVRLNPMSDRQPAALAETWPCSPVRSNPHRLDLPTTAIAFSGLVELSRVGDKPRNGAALVGFTERDRQAAWLDPRAAYLADLAPILLVAGASGSGKTLLMQHLADQFARAQTPVVMIDPKPDSDLSPAVRASGGQVASLDDLLSADGIFDPLRFGMSPETSVELAANMLLSVNPWGSKAQDLEVPINTALVYGVDQGAQCIGQALILARDDGRADKWMVDQVLELAESAPMFRAVCGLTPETTALRAAQGITYIRVGKANLSLPEPGAVNLNLVQRVSVNLVRLMVSGAAMALTGRQGVVMLDEAWVFMGSGNTELERLARVARSQNVTVMLYTQRVSDATLSGIDEHIAGGFILPLKEAEAIAACRILNLEPTPERIRRITAKATVGEEDAASGGAPNYDSMRALHVAGSRKVERGTIALFADIHDRVVPTEIVVAESFLAKASTHREDIDARKPEAA